jgi:hypothetical protein
MPIPTRRLPINGGYNYRDLGGYPTLTAIPSSGADCCGLAVCTA